METPKVFTTNKYGISIVKCCASCKFKMLDKNYRRCSAGEGNVPASFLCSNWTINPTLETVGRGGGKIKKAGYLHYSLDRLIDDYNKAVVAYQNGERYSRLSISDVRSEYAKFHGDIYAMDEKKE